MVPLRGGGRNSFYRGQFVGLRNKYLKILIYKKYGVSIVNNYQLGHQFYVNLPICVNKIKENHQYCAF